jgi:hypothetical protein
LRVTLTFRLQGIGEGPYSPAKNIVMPLGSSGQERAMTVRPTTPHSCAYLATMGAAAMALAGALSGCSGQTYSCGNPEGGHCYGTVQWTGAPSGLSAEITMVPLTSGDIFIDDEVWLVDYFAPGDPLAGAYWVETGIWNEGYGTDYFWANNVPTWGFMSYDLGPVAQDDLDHANWIAFKIKQNAQTASQWDVTISRASNGSVLFSPSSTGNQMSPTTIIEGQELAGSQNAQAPLAFFGFSSVIQGGATSLRTNDGSVRADHPPNAGWWPLSKPSQTNNGGLFFTDCC